MIATANDRKRLAIAVSKLYLACGRAADELTLEAYREGFDELEIELLEWAIREASKVRTEFVASVAEIREIYFAERASRREAAAAEERKRQFASVRKARAALPPAERERIDQEMATSFQRLKERFGAWPKPKGEGVAK